MRRLDHKVEFRSEERIAARALACRRVANLEFHGTFNVTKFFDEELGKALESTLPSRKFYEEGHNETSPGYVVFSTPDTRGRRQAVLYIEREIWNYADLGDVDSRYIVAHEIGHIALGHYHATPFSNDSSLQISYGMDEESAEWQAHAFARHFLLPDHIVRQFIDLNQMIEYCDVNEELGRRRFTEVHRFDGAACANCGNFTLVRRGLNLSCATCKCSGAVSAF